MKYFFKAKDDTGKVISGRVEASNEQEAADVLQKKSLVPISIEEGGKFSLLRDLNQAWEGARSRDLVVLFRQLATLIKAKVPVLSSLRAIQNQTENTFIQGTVKDIGDDIEDGMSLSEALARHPNVFTPLVVNMIRSGEVSGNLQQSISYVADNIEKNYQLASKIRGALFYPIFVIIVAIIIGFIVLTFILPRITEIIKDLEIEIPWYTQVIIWVGDFMKAYWWAVLAVIIAGIISFVYYIKSESGRREWDVIKLRIPIIGKMYSYVYLARFADNLSTLLNGGIPLVKALMIVSDVVGNSVYQAAILRAADEVKKGGNMSSVFARSETIPPIVTQMVQIGEETGQISETLKSVSGFYEQEVDTMTRNLTSLIEPILIVILGIGVAILVFAVLMPIYNIAGQL